LYQGTSWFLSVPKGKFFPQYFPFFVY
jgi:hypothetical protein